VNSFSPEVLASYVVFDGGEYIRKYALVSEVVVPTIDR
jgi:hypothetical protein